MRKSVLHSRQIADHSARRDRASARRRPRGSDGLALHLVLAACQHVGAVGDLERLHGILLHDDDGNALVGDPAYRDKQFVHNF